METAAAIVLCAGIVIGALWLIRANVWAYFDNRDGSWHASDGKMRRRVNGRWEYREMTDEEASEDRSSRAW